MDKKTMKLINQIEKESKDKPQIKELCKILKDQIKKDKSTEAKKIINELAKLCPELKDIKQDVENKLIESNEEYINEKIIFDQIVINNTLYWIDKRNNIWDDSFNFVGFMSNNNFIIVENSLATFDDLDLLQISLK